MRNYSEAFFRAHGKIGGLTTKKKYGKEYYKKIGKKGGLQKGRNQKVINNSVAIKKKV